MLRRQRSIEIVPSSKPLRWRRYDVPQYLAPETSDARRFGAVEGDLELLDRRHWSQHKGALIAARVAIGKPYTFVMFMLGLGATHAIDARNPAVWLRAGDENRTRVLSVGISTGSNLANLSEPRRTLYPVQRRLPNNGEPGWTQADVP